MPDTRFQFNRQLVRHFIETAQPYFFPTEPRDTTETTKVKYITKNTWTFLGLIIVVVLMDFMSQVQSHMMSSQYSSLLKKANLKNYNR